MKKNISILGSTGSIGRTTLDVISSYPDRFRVVGLSARENVDLMEVQIRKFNPLMVAMVDEGAAKVLKRRCPHVEVSSGMEGLIKIATLEEAHMVISAIAGSAGLIPTLSAIKAEKTIGLANKETLVMAGAIITEEVRARGITILPIDSEHSAIFQVMAGERWEDVRRLILTASGGPFLGASYETKKRATVKDALKHPNWNMGTKVTIDSATLMNKGLEVIEAHWLFGVPVENIEVLIHPQSIIHSMVEFRDGAIKAQMGIPDMQIPIAYALSFPERLDLKLPALDLAEVGNLTFQKPDPEEFPCLVYAYEALRKGGTMPAVLNSANEVAVKAFIQGEIGFLDIERVVGETMAEHEVQPVKSIEDVLSADSWARKVARGIIKEIQA